MKIGFHTDAFNSFAFSFEKALAWAQRNDVHFIEPGLIDGACWIHGLGYFPHVALYQDPALLRQKMAKYGVRFSQVDAAYPLSGKDGPSIGLPYVLKSIPWAAHAGCDHVATTDGLHAPEGLSDDQAMVMMQRCYEQIVRTAEAYGVTATIEVNGYFTTDPDKAEAMLGFVDSPNLRMNFDTGNSFIAGQDPVEFCRRFIHKIDHVHVKDVSPSLAESLRGKDTGIAISHCAIGDGVNADNIRQCLEMLRDHGFDGVLSMECEGQGGPLIEKSLAWLRRTMQELHIPEEKE